MRGSLTVFRYEMFNVISSKWLYFYTTLLAFSTFGLSYLADDARKAQLSLVSILGVIVPLVSILFTTTYWYNTERFTELLLAQPVSRARLFWSRILALTSSLSGCLLFGLALPCILCGVVDIGLLWLLLASVISGGIFCILGALIATTVVDRMWGVGLALACLFYLIVIHDSGLLLMLYWLRDYPLEVASGLICAVNPIGLMRVVLLMHFDAPLLLGHAGALVRRLVETGAGYWIAFVIASCWLVIPAFVAKRQFLRRDF